MFEYARNVQDASLTPAVFALSNGAGSTNSTAIDLGADTYKQGIPEFELSVPVLNTTMVPDTKTVTYIVETSTTSNFAAIDQTLMAEVQTGAGGVGVSAFRKRCRPQSNCARYVRFKVTLGAATGDASSISATGKPLF